ncbi:MAG: UbiA family prenyltransferase [Bythopirellula sp.]
MNASPTAAWWQLLRAGNLLTAVSNILAGFLLAKGEWQPLLPLVFLVLSSAALYLAGMVLNDVFDLETDRVHRPERPLPSASIDPQTASLIGWGLIFDGISGAAVAAWLIGSWLPLIIGCLLAASIVAYDSVLKSTWFGPVAMGACRALNVLLGASVVAPSSDKQAVYLYAAVLGIYTIGLTLLARKEAQQSLESEIKMAGQIVQFAVVLMLLLAALLTLPKFGWFATWLVCFLAVRVSLYNPLIDPAPASVRKAVSQLITMFIPLDALACVAAAGWPAGLIVLALLLPTYVATRHVSMT